MNKVILHGRLTRDPEIRTTQTGKLVASMGLAVNRPGQDKGADFINLVAWNQTAEIAGKYLSKGREVLVEGQITTRSYEKDGAKRTVTEVIVGRLEFCGSKPTEEPAANDLPNGFVEDNEDVPF